MSNILVVYETEMPSVTGFINDTIASKPDDLEYRFKQVLALNNDDIDWCDTLLFIRPQSVVTDIIAKKAKKTGAFVITFCDDDLLNLPKGIPSIPWRTRGLVRTLESSDILQSTSPYICEKYKHYTIGKRGVCTHTTVMPDSLNEMEYVSKEVIPIKIVYAAGRDHSALFNELVLPVLPKLKERYKDKITFTFVGVRPDVSECEKFFETKVVAGMPLMEYRKFMKESKFDIGLAPLHDTEFNRCKYFNKYIEYTLVGVPGIYSKIEPYTYVIKDKKNGILVSNTPDEWYEGLCSLIDDFKLRKDIFDNSKEHLLENFSPDILQSKFREDVPEYFKKKNSIGKCASLKSVKLKYNFYRIFDVIYLFFYYWKYEGIKSTINKVKARL